MSHVDFPPTLYHYTSATGMLGMLDSRELWLTSVHYLNDRNEFLHTTSLTYSLISEKRRGASETQKAVLNGLVRTLDNIGRINTCVFSLSENGDLLSQWRGYCPADGGYSIGFDTAKLRAVAHANGLLLVRCEYDRDSQVEKLRGHLDAITTQFEADVTRGMHVEYATTAARARLELLLMELAPTFKDPSFAEEREWRLLTVPQDFRTMRYRAAGNLVVPYATLTLASTPSEMPIVEVVVGPSLNQSLLRLGVMAYRASGRCAIASVRESSIPYRQR